jgi:hypothetical protein
MPSPESACSPSGIRVTFFEWLPWNWHNVVLWLFGVEFAASPAVCLLVLPQLLLPPSLSLSPPLSSSMHLAPPMLLLLLLLLLFNAFTSCTLHQKRDRAASA